jgi:hypothetical protein
MNSHKSIVEFLDYIDGHLSTRSMMKGGSESTQPYKSYESILNNVYEYVNYVFMNNETNKKELSRSIEELDGCRKYRNELCGKEEEYVDIARTMTPMEEGVPEDEIARSEGVLLRKGEELE